MICKITNFLRIFFNRKKFVKFEFSIYAPDVLRTPLVCRSAALASEVPSDLASDRRTVEDHSSPRTTKTLNPVIRVLISLPVYAKQTTSRRTETSLLLLLLQMIEGRRSVSLRASCVSAVSH